MKYKTAIQELALADTWAFVSGKKIVKKQMAKPSNNEIISAKNGKWMKLKDAKKEGYK